MSKVSTRIKIKLGFWKEIGSSRSEINCQKQLSKVKGVSKAMIQKITKSFNLVAKFHSLLFLLCHNSSRQELLSKKMRMLHLETHNKICIQCFRVDLSFPQPIMKAKDLSSDIPQALQATQWV